MKALILAAGSGSRLRESQPDTPKPLVKLGGIALLERTARSCIKAGCTELVIVIGSEADLVQSTLSPRLKQFPITWVRNSEWECGNGSSVLKARPYLEKESRFLVSMSDHLIFPQTIRKLIEASQQTPSDQTLMAVDQKHELLADLPDAMKVQVKDQHIVQIAKSLTFFNAIDIGIAVCTPYFFELLEGIASKSGGLCSHGQGMQELSKENKLMSFDIGDDLWEDVDTYPAYERAKKILFNSLRKPTDGWMSQHVERFLSLSITRLLVHTPITPNLVSLVVICIGAYAAYLFAQPGYWTKVFGALVFWCSSFLDGCDGELSRVTYQESRLGGWLDLWGDNIIHMMVFAGMGVGLWKDTGSDTWLLLGRLAALGVFLTVTWVSYKTLRRKKSAGPLFTSVTSEKAKGSAWSGKLSQLADAMARRDFIFGVIFIALFNGLSYFLWAAALGSFAYLSVLLMIEAVSYFKAAPEH